MKKHFSFGLFFLLGLVACSTRAEVYKMDVSEFDAVELKVPADVVWTDTDKATCVVTCSPEQEKKIEVVMDGKVLIVKKKGKMDWGWGDGDKITIQLSSSGLRKVGIYGSGDFVMKSSNDTPGFEFSIHGSGDIKAIVNAKTCEGNIHGSGDALIKGTADSFDLDIRGSGDVKARDLLCKSVDVDIAGSGDATVYATEQLKVQIAGSGDVRYAGNPRNLVQKVAGSGELQKI
jgi:hypothetical protein